MARERALELGKGATERVVRRMATMEDVWEADLLSFVLFDGEHAGRLIDLGRNDVLARADEVRAFFHGMQSRGVNLAPSAYEAGFVSSMHGAEEIEQTIEAAAASFAEMNSSA